MNKNPSTSLGTRGFAPIAIILIIVGVLAVGGTIYYYFFILGRGMVQTVAPPSPISLCETDSDCINVIVGDIESVKSQACVNKNYKSYKQQPYDFPGKILSETGEDKCKCLQWGTEKTVYKTCEFKQEIDTSNWQTYRNEKYGFEVKYPADWIFSEGYSQQTTEGSILTGSHNSFHISSKGNDYVSINPEGAIHAEDENPKISFINIGDAKAQQMEWDKWPKYKVIRVLDEKPNWLKDFNVIMVVSDKYDKIIQQLLSTFKFTK